MNGAEHEGLLTIFLAEAEELLQQLHEQLAELRYGVDGQRLLDDLNRSFDTLQGGAAVMKLTPMSALAERCGMVIERLRRRRLPMTPRLFSLLETAALELGRMMEMLVRGESINTDTETLQHQLLQSIQEGLGALPEVADDAGSDDPLQQFFESTPTRTPDTRADPQAGEAATIPPAIVTDTALHHSRVNLDSAGGAPSSDVTVERSEDLSWQPLQHSASGIIQALPELSPRTSENSAPAMWRPLAEAAVLAHRRGDDEALGEALNALADWLDQH